VREAEEVKRLGLVDAPRRTRPGSVPSEFDEPRFVGMQFKSELRQLLTKVAPELTCIALMLKTGDKVVSKTHDDHVSSGAD
jgi:hypothetical protein